MNKFTTSESTTTLNEIFQKTNFIDIEEFKKCIIYLVENQYLVQTSIIIISKLKMKNELNYQKSMSNKFSSLMNNKNEFNLEEEKGEDKIENKGNIFFEDFLKLVKNKSIEDFFILANIKDLINKQLFINEISYYSGYKIKDILNVINKYDAIFDLVVVPL